MKALPRNVKENIASHLYFQKYTGKLNIRMQGNYSWWRRRHEKLAQVYQEIWYGLDDMFDISNKKKFRTRYETYSISVFTTDAKVLRDMAIAASDLLAAMTRKYGTVETQGMNIEMFSMTEEQATASTLDAKIMHRKSHWYGKYEWRLEVNENMDFFNVFEGLCNNLLEENELEAQKEYIEGTADAMDDRYGSRAIKGENSYINGRLVYGRSRFIVYTKNEDMAALARLMIPGLVTVYRSVIPEGETPEVTE